MSILEYFFHFSAAIAFLLFCHFVASPFYLDNTTMVSAHFTLPTGFPDGLLITVF